MNIDEQVEYLNVEYKITINQYSELAKQKTFPNVKTKKWVGLIQRKWNGGEYKYTFTAFSSAISITRKNINLDTNTITLTFAIWNGQDEIEVEEPRELIFDKNLVKLFNYGLTVNTKSIQSLCQYLNSSDTNAKCVQVFSSLGWEDKGFKSSKLFSGDKEALYGGIMDIQPNGSLDEWENLIQNHVLKNTALEMVLVLGFCSPILSFLNQTYDLGCLIFNIANSSSKGKTTSGMLAVSVFGNPVFDKSFLVNFNSTHNALIGFASLCNGHTVCFDEVATAEKESFRKLLYILATGRDKMRLNGDSKIKQKKTFESVILTTAEFPLLDDSSPNGLRARIFELTDELTKDSTHSDIIKQTVIQNYSLAGEKFIEYLIGNTDLIINEYKKCKEHLLSMYKDNDCGSLRDRIISKFAVVLATTSLMNGCFDFKINFNNFAKYLVKLERQASKGAMNTDTFIDLIVQEVQNNSNKYIRIGKNQFSQNNIEGARGVIEKKTNGTQVIYILKNNAEYIFEKNHINNPKVLLQELKSEGRLVAEKDRLTKRKKLSEDLPSQPCYAFKINALGIYKKPKENNNATEEKFLQEFTNDDLSF